MLNNVDQYSATIIENQIGKNNQQNKIIKNISGANNKQNMLQMYMSNMEPESVSKEFLNQMAVTAKAGAKEFDNEFDKLQKIAEKYTKRTAEALDDFTENVIKDSYDGTDEKNGVVGKLEKDKNVALEKATLLKAKITQSTEEEANKLKPLYDRYVTINDLNEDQINKEIQINAEIDKQNQKVEERKNKEKELANIVSNAATTLSAITMTISSAEALIDNISSGQDINITALASSVVSVTMGINMAKTALTGLFKTIEFTMPEVVAIIAAIALLLKGIEYVYNTIKNNTPEAKLAAAKQESIELANALDKAKQEAEDLKNAFDGYNNIVETLNDLERGTAE